MSLIPYPKIYIHNNSNETLNLLKIKILAPYDIEKNFDVISPSEVVNVVIKKTFSDPTKCVLEPGKICVSYTLNSGTEKDEVAFNSIVLKAYLSYHIYINDKGVYKAEEKEL